MEHLRRVKAEGGDTASVASQDARQPGAPYTVSAIMRPFAPHFLGEINENV